MHFLPTAFVAAASLVAAASAAETSLDRLGLAIRSDLMSCEETYGGGWAPCGDEQSSKFCYSPLLGQSCCTTDNGYCDVGTYCAPMAGHCCIDGEELATCASNAGFQLPGDVPGEELRFGGSGLLSSSLVSTNLSSNGRANLSNAVTAEPPVQVSVARKGCRAPIWTACIGVVALYML
ncbi:hypothetical protein B0T18DRAFT_147556 [Schizothecium vesticola]|uniref:GPI anchored protein n=1 Tax=Schizothecium vesticola TaxID=314040 RepID=A0AA40EVF2_9PEZI|nr:hypothetical protein B0T18DRAFT_147556 [Schizothecium vesticola]